MSVYNRSQKTINLCNARVLPFSSEVDATAASFETEDTSEEPEEIDDPSVIIR